MEEECLAAMLFLSDGVLWWEEAISVKYFSDGVVRQGRLGWEISRRFVTRPTNGGWRLG